MPPRPATVTRSEGHSWVQELPCQGILTASALCHSSLTTPQAFQGIPGAQESGVQVKAFRLTMRRAKADDGNASCTSHFPSRTWAEEEEEEGCMHEGTAHLDEDVITVLGDLAPESTCPPVHLSPSTAKVTTARVPKCHIHMAVEFPQG